MDQAPFLMMSEVGGHPPRDVANDQSASDSTAPATILVVDSEVVVRTAVSAYLRNCGYRVHEATSADEAQAVIGSGKRIDIVFTDVTLDPGTSGFALAAWVRRNYPSVRVLLVSGVSRMTQEAADLCNGRVFTKPYSHQELAEEIRRLLDRVDNDSDTTSKK